MTKKNLVLVDQNDQPIGEIGKLEAHLGKAKRHRAFTVFLKNSDNEFLVCRRSLKKPLWPLFWDAAFSSHPWVGELLEEACERRVFEELGIHLKGFNSLFHYEYHVQWNDVFSEWEINHILIANFTKEINPRSEEVTEYRWISWAHLISWTRENSEWISPWFDIAIRKINKDKKLQNIFL